MKKFVVVPELQDFLSGVDSRALDNVLFDVAYNEDSLLPQNPDATRRILFFDKAETVMGATPSPTEYNCYRQDLNGTSIEQITYPRQIL